MAKHQSFRKHETSTSHIYAASNYHQYMLHTNTQNTVLDVMDKSPIGLIRKSRQRLTKIASTLLLCARQSILIRGRDENEL